MRVATGQFDDVPRILHTPQAEILGGGLGALAALGAGVWVPAGVVGGAALGYFCTTAPGHRVYYSAREFKEWVWERLHQLHGDVTHAKDAVIAAAKHQGPRGRFAVDLTEQQVSALYAEPSTGDPIPWSAFVERYDRSIRDAKQKPRFELPPGQALKITGCVRDIQVTPMAARTYEPLATIGAGLRNKHDLAITAQRNPYFDGDPTRKAVSVRITDFEERRRAKAKPDDLIGRRDIIVVLPSLGAVA